MLQAGDGPGQATLGGEGRQGERAAWLVLVCFPCPAPSMKSMTFFALGWHVMCSAMVCMVACIIWLPATVHSVIGDCRQHGPEPLTRSVILIAVILFISLLF